MIPNNGSSGQPNHVQFEKPIELLVLVGKYELGLGPALRRKDMGEVKRRASEILSCAEEGTGSCPPGTYAIYREVITSIRTVEELATGGYRLDLWPFDDLDIRISALKRIAISACSGGKIISVSGELQRGY